MSDEQRSEGVEHDPVALHKDHDTVAQQRAEKEEKEKHPKPADYAETDKELAQKGGDPKERRSERTD
jgi:hypothetical protein